MIFFDEPISIVRDLVGLYKISNLGKVICVKTGRKVKAYQNCNNYLCVRLKGRSGKSYSAPVHCLVADAFLENPDRGVYTTINHKDEDKTNADVRNLEWCTPKYNNHYSIAKRCLLSPTQIVDLESKIQFIKLLSSPIFTKTERKMHKDAHRSMGEPVTLQELADMYKISVATLYKIERHEGYYGFVLYQNIVETCYDKWINEFGKLCVDKALEKTYPVHYLDGAVPYKEKIE